MAKKKKTIKPEEIKGLSIYQEEKRTIYAPFFLKKAYLVTDKNVKQYVSYIQGYLVAIVVFIIAYVIYRKVSIPLILSLLFLISSFVMFYINFLRKASVIDNFKKQKGDSFITRQADNLEIKNLWTIIIASPLLALAIMFNSYLNHYEGFMLYIMIFLSVIAVAYGILNIYILIYKKNNLKEENKDTE